VESNKPLALVQIARAINKRWVQILEAATVEDTYEGFVRVLPIVKILRLR